SHAKDVNDARHDGFYRTNAGRFLVREGNKLHATQLLLEASDELDRVRGLARSELAFLEVVGIREVKSTSNYVYDVSVPGAENFLAGSGGVFCHNTGSGKSNLTSTLIRKAMRAHPDLTTVVFDVAGEYATHLVDLLESGGRILTHEPIEDDEQLFNSQAIPESLEDIVGESALRGAFSRVFVKGLVKKLAFGDRYSALDLAAVEDMLTKTAEDGKTSSMVARMALESFARRFYDELELQPNVRLAELPESAKSALLAILEDLRERSHEKSGLRTEVDAILEYVKSGKETAPERKEMTPERVAAELAFEKSPRLNIFYLPEPHRARIIASQVIDRLLYLRKRGGSRKKVLVVLDEAQEYIPAEPRERDGTLSSNLAVENLLRQGRKYRVHCWLATQRVARLNVSALQQLHSYFVSTLPRFYDRMVVAESFALPYEVLERSAQLDTGEWIFVSFKATKQKNVPVFVKTENNEGVVANYLKRK
ncbi:MAG: DUF87 domain-containing protein, partial [Thaumarchaeota archaeon]|nr:DUF87 domain-containing protein [Nitrososphaerota archaeon]